MKNDPFQALGVEVTATDEQIKAAYRDLAWRLHPDRVATKTPPEARLAERRMREVNEAWATIGTPERRAAYESARRAARTGSSRTSSARTGSAKSSSAKTSSARANGNGRGAPSPSDPRGSTGSARSSARPGENRREPLRDWRAYAPGGDAADDGQQLVGVDADEDDLVDMVDDQHFWLFRGLVPFVIVVTLLVIVVATAFAGGLSSPSSPTVSAGVGDCVLGNRLVTCDEPHDARVMGVADEDGTCPSGQTVRALARSFCVTDEN